MRSTKVWSVKYSSFSFLISQSLLDIGVVVVYVSIFILPELFLKECGSILFDNKEDVDTFYKEFESCFEFVVSVWESNTINKLNIIKHLSKLFHGHSQISQIFFIFILRHIKSSLGRLRFHRNMSKVHFMFYDFWE